MPSFTGRLENGVRGVPGNDHAQQVDDAGLTAALLALMDWWVVPRLGGAQRPSHRRTPRSLGGSVPSLPLITCRTNHRLCDATAGDSAGLRRGTLRANPFHPVARRSRRVTDAI